MSIPVLSVYLPFALPYAGYGAHRFIIEATEDGMQRKQRAMLENAEHFLIQSILGDTVMMIQSRLCCPTNIECGGDMVRAQSNISVISSQ